MTGRGMGFCAGFDSPGFRNVDDRDVDDRNVIDGESFGMGRAWRRGGSRGFRFARPIRTNN